MKSLISFLCLLALAASAEARPRPHGFEGKRFEANKTFGLGIELGEPTALTGKYFYSESKAIDFGVGDVYNYDSYRGFYLYADHLWHPLSLASTDAFELPFYVGVGGAFWSWTDYRFAPVYSGDALAVRVPIGISFDFNEIPIDIFLQIVPTVNLFFDVPAGYPRSAFYPFLDASVGVRYWFN